MCFGGTALVDDVPAIADFIPAAERPVGSTAIARELGARLVDENTVDWSDNGYKIADQPFPVFMLTLEKFGPALEAGYIHA
ncbi:MULTISPECIES: hypothetical protein [unclassified Sphingomonas]|uniref:hypothetical protein n=1 Tax=unclassified Sphingomonas TaxID=196159 RepID=UPI00215096DB|nr:MULTISPECIES: hypothetical protein [unclassified Sphingomonas]MCR5870658.1 hypothetical protein [Sphingomonas sp. J344]UUY01004.1 hypothetical protein LRS08_08095 [Sphingomonas sp. J315]